MAHKCVECVFSGTEVSVDKYNNDYEKDTIKDLAVEIALQVDYCYEQPEKIERKKESPACCKIHLKK